MAVGPTLALALASFLANGRAANAGEIDLCVEAIEVVEDPQLGGELGELALEDLAGDGRRDCAPVELLPDAACEDAPSTIWPLAVSACDTPLFKLRGPHRGPRLGMPSPGRRPLKGVAASDLGSFRVTSGHSAPLPEKDLTFSQDPASLLNGDKAPATETRLPFDRDALPALADGHARRLERPPEA